MLRQLDDNLWVTERPLRFGGVELGARMTVIRLRGGDLFLHSPVGLDAALRGELEHLGTPRFAVAPNRFHHLYIGGYRDAFPGIQLYAAPGLPKKRGDLRFDGVLDCDGTPHGWSGEIDQVFVRGYALMNEVVFCHRASRSLLTCDLMFNMREDAPLMTRLAFRLIGGYGRCGPTLVERVFVRDAPRRARRCSTFSLGTSIVSSSRTARCWSTVAARRCAPATIGCWPRADALRGPSRRGRCGPPSGCGCRVGS